MDPESSFTKGLVTSF